MTYGSASHSDIEAYNRQCFTADAVADNAVSAGRDAHHHLPATDLDSGGVVRCRSGLTWRPYTVEGNHARDLIQTCDKNASLCVVTSQQDRIGMN